ncbi:MAG: hypothetical protein ACP5F3_06060, partial [Candidatus Syntrophosphaera sp.]
MRRLQPLIAFLALFSALPALLAAENLVVEKIIELAPETYSYRLAQSPVISRSEKVFSDTLQLARNLDYELNPQTATLTLLKFPSTPFLKVTFILVPPQITEPKYLYQVR